ncbi:MAG: TonB-dependent receptor, partial [Bacteroidota bacterium]
TMDLASFSDQSDADYLAGSQYQIGNFVTPQFLGNLNFNDASLFDISPDPSEFLGENYSADENIYGAYAMWNQNITENFSFLAGLRVEHTSLSYTGNEFEDEETLLGEVNNDRSYTNVLPGLHLKYNPLGDLIFRAAWTNTLARPNYFDLVPFRDVRPGDEELNLGNPNLDATESMNFDFSVENYFESIGLVSASFFYKNVDNFIYAFVNDDFTNDPAIPDGEEWTFTQAQNGGSADVYGIELSFQRQLDFLPGIWKGLGVYLNYTYTNSDADGIRNEDGELREGDFALPGTAPHTFNASLSFETKRLVIRSSVNFADSYLDELGGDSFSDRFYDHQFFLDINASYAIKPFLRVFFEATNLTDQPLRYYQGISTRTMQEEYYGRRLTLGLKFDLFK